MSIIRYEQTQGKSLGFYALIAGLGAFILAALGAVYFMEHNGHHVTGMSNRIVWGLPHVFALFLIVAASGALNIASIASVFNKKVYKPLSRLSGLVALALLAGGLMVLVLDLGRPDRLIIAMTEYNFNSIFAWNIILYNGFFVIIGVYLWMMFERRMNKYSRTIGIAAFTWRLILTTGTGSIFGFLVARQAYDAVIMAPMFVIMSFAFGLAFFILVLMASYKWTARPLGNAIVNRLSNLLGVFVAAVMYFVTVYHLGNLYLAENSGVENFILVDGGIYTKLFWYGQIILGGLVPLALLYSPATKGNRTMLGLASALIILGGIVQLYIIIIGGQAYPMELFPGKEILEGYVGIAAYTPTLPELMLGLGGIAVAVIAITYLVKFLPFLPESLADDVVDPHHKK
ncbi:Sulfite reduction-associated complex DsrMKJOP protein DsrP (= HmeB) [Bathymodiolus heckerae thiotrophic gill symbiont]|uniref:NrfD/PsrC family molybdoenzyme membrane anchor subunit n=1 Tax=Bathymodiolus heckerae thiotrophic gill symbiont TaxID=1052212 RepID=UPI0010B9BCDD|nr:NrfD/PsrC family molybdoenzyme membrane anchor subunit [Bathymodiolus heckerae thiotrophic gill symbiont]CAC9595585.1 Sulfite reduction-associated complex DsrMKJOP protein DsrP (HmeB) [uncultured Gammaproteobacteria bacterium]SHN90370.1 Sulfite reduction-associated complex DsrMKJOP protein DsrP (= HmeB) [Bathymodiolus heckerae thiotrophic gill symbiont]